MMINNGMNSLGYYGGGAPCAMAMAGTQGSMWGQDSLVMELEALLSELEGGQQSQGCQGQGGNNNPMPSSGGSQMPGQFPGACQAPPAQQHHHHCGCMAGSFPGSSPSSGSGSPSAPAGQVMMPSVQFQGNQPSNSNLTQTTNMLSNGDVSQNVNFSGATGSQLTSINNMYNPNTGIEQSTETAANGDHAYVTTQVQGNEDISTVTGDADVTGGVNKFVVSMNGDQEDCTEYKNDGTTTSWVDTNSAGQTLSPWSAVTPGNMNESYSGTSTANGWSTSYSPNSSANYTATYT